MKALLICPSERSGMKLLGRSSPLVTAPLLGQSLLEYWFSSLSLAGAQTVLLLAHDRPEQVEALAQDGARWGISVRVIPESRELTPAQASIKYSHELDPGTCVNSIAVLDHFPGLEQYPLFNSHRELMAGIATWLPHALTPDRVGFRESRPGVWISTLACVSPEAKLQAPCWIGSYTRVGAGSVIGPNGFVEDGVVLEAGAEVVNSCIGPGTFVGRLARVRNSMALGNLLVNLQSETVLEVNDPFILSSLRKAPQFAQSRRWGRVLDRFGRRKEEASWVWKYLALNKEG